MSTFRLVMRCGACEQEIDYAVTFWTRVDKTSHPKGCWLWTGLRGKSGYGRLKIKHKNLLAHRISYQYKNGSIPENSTDQVCHTCDNPACVNPDHLYLGNAYENAYDRELRGRGFTGKQRKNIQGEKHPQAILNSTQALEIRKRLTAGEKRSKLALEYGVSYNTVVAIAIRRSWKHLP